MPSFAGSGAWAATPADMINARRTIGVGRGVLFMEAPTGTSTMSRHEPTDAEDDPDLRRAPGGGIIRTTVAAVSLPRACLSTGGVPGPDCPGVPGTRNLDRRPRVSPRAARRALRGQYAGAADARHQRA